jgi:hypothetical protein
MEGVLDSVTDVQEEDEDEDEEELDELEGERRGDAPGLR